MDGKLGYIRAWTEYGSHDVPVYALRSDCPEDERCYGKMDFISKLDHGTRVFAWETFKTKDHGVYVNVVKASSPPDPLMEGYVSVDDLCFDVEREETITMPTDAQDQQQPKCTTRGCERPPWNNEHSNACCRTCWYSYGRKHGPECERRTRERACASSQSVPTDMEMETD